MLITWQSPSSPTLSSIRSGTEDKSCPFKNSLATPRIAAVVSRHIAYLDIVTKDGLNVSSFPLEENECLMVTTYEKTMFSHLTIETSSAEDVAKKMYDPTFEKPVCAAGAYQVDDHFELGVYNGPQ